MILCIETTITSGVCIGIALITITFLQFDYQVHGPNNCADDTSTETDLSVGNKRYLCIHSQITINRFIKLLVQLQIANLHSKLTVSTTLAFYTSTSFCANLIFPQPRLISLRPIVALYNHHILLVSTSADS
jgi:hypothetical protein